MKSYDEFRIFHPLVNLIYFIFVIALCMVALHPYVQVPGLIGAFGYLAYMRGRSALKNLAFALMTAMGAVAFNVLFNHRGATILAYFPNGNPFTLESVTHGLAMGSSLGCVLLWFACFNQVFTSDRLVCLTGRLSPTLSLMLTLILGFVPMFARGLKAAARDRGLFYGGGIVNGIKTLENTGGQMLEQAMELGDIMRGRGMGLKGRSAYSPFTIHLRDIILLVIFIPLGVLALICGPKAEYLPVYSGGEVDPVGMVAVAVVTLLPLMLNLVYGEIKWRRLK